VSVSSHKIDTHMAEQQLNFRQKAVRNSPSRHLFGPVRRAPKDRNMGAVAPGRLSTGGRTSVVSLDLNSNMGGIS
jgi:hypothetical protein